LLARHPSTIIPHLHLGGEAQRNHRFHPQRRRRSAGAREVSKVPVCHSPQIFVDTSRAAWARLRLAIFDAKNQMIMRGEWVEGMRQLLALLPERNRAR
ncbi:MAG: hypothetical protein M3463_23270, partial [Verrucomicrobiota bacterium]|nr:hypothetical protein [Verrucomicrobiota bacterium]